jgi:4-aminobutyrate aminotransferase-like enzyme
VGNNGKSAKYLKKAKEFVVHSLAWPGVEKGMVLESASGAILRDIEGKEYIDAVSGTNGPLLIGHCHPAMADALSLQSRKLSHVLGFFDNVPLVDLCEKLASITPPSVKKSYLCTGGGEAVETAVKLVMKRTGKAEFISLHYGYHGLSLGTMSLGGIPGLRSFIPGGLRWPGFQQVPNPYCYRCPFGASRESCGLECAAALEAALDHGTSGHVAAVILEPVQGPGGHIELPKRYADRVQEICADRGIYLMVDEVQTGLGRCGSWFASDLIGLKPDVLIVGKALGGGYPVGAAVFSEKIATGAVEAETWHSLTFQNDPLGAAVGLAVLGVIERERLIDRANAVGRRVKEKLAEFAGEFPVIGEVRGPGLFIGIELVRNRVTKEPAVEETAAGIAHAREIGLITMSGGAGNVLKIKAPLVITDEQVERMMGLFRETFRFIQSKAGR